MKLNIILLITLWSLSVIASPTLFKEGSINLQAVSIGDSSAADAKSLLDIKSTTKGVLFPRMTSTQMNAISSPTTGLMIWNTTAANLYQYNGSSWVPVGTLSPLTTKGDLYTWDTTNARLPVGSNNQLLIADSAQSTGLKWGLASLTSNVTGILPIANGGTNSSTTLNNNRVMQSSGGAIVEAAAITANRALISDANGIPTHSAVTNTELGYVSGVTSSIQTQLNGKSTSTLTNGHIFIGNASNIAQDQNVTGDIAITNAGVTSYSGTVPIGKGGTGQTTANAALNALLPSQSGAANKVLTSDGTNTSWAPGFSISTFGTMASPRSLAAATGITSGAGHMSTTANKQVVIIQNANSYYEAVSANPQIQAGTILGQEMRIVCASSTAIFSLSDGNGLSLNGDWYPKQNGTLDLYWNGSVWAENTRSFR